MVYMQAVADLVTEITLPSTDVEPSEDNSGGSISRPGGGAILTRRTPC